MQSQAQPVLSTWVSQNPPNLLCYKEEGSAQNPTFSTEHPKPCPCPKPHMGQHCSSFHALHPKQGSTLALFNTHHSMSPQKGGREEKGP